MAHEKSDLLLAFAFEEISEADFCQAMAIRPSEMGALIYNVLFECLRLETGDDVEAVLIIGSRVGFDARHIGVLCELLSKDWHQRHEDIVQSLGELKPEHAIATLSLTALRRFPYLDYSDASPLGVKCVYALLAIQSPAAIFELKRLAEIGDPVVRERAARKLREHNLS